MSDDVTPGPDGPRSPWSRPVDFLPPGSDVMPAAPAIPEPAPVAPEPVEGPRSSLPHQVLGAVAGLGVGYLATALLTVLTMAGMVLHPSLRQAINGTVAQVGAVDLFAGLGAFASGVCQIVALGFGGRLHGTVGVMRVSMVAWLSVPVVSTLLAVLVSVYAVTRLVLASHRPASRRAAVPGAALAGLASGLLVLGLARVAAFGQGVVVHAAGPVPFVVAALLVGVASWLGSVHAGGLKAFDGHPLMREAGRAVSVLAHFLAVFSLVMAVGGGAVTLFTVILDDGFGAAAGDILAAPMVAGNLLLALLALGVGGTIGASSGPGTGSSHLGSSTLSAATLPPVLLLVLLVAVVAGLVLAGMRWAGQRRVGRVNAAAETASWLFLPVAFGLLGLAMLANQVQVGARTSMAAGMAVSYGPNAWTPFGMVLLGLLADLVARFLAPALVGGPRASLRSRRFAVVGAAVVAVVVALTLVAMQVVRSLEANTYGPQQQASKVLDALVVGDVDKVLDLAPQSNPVGPLVTSAIYQKVADRPSAYRVTGVHTQGDQATVSTLLTMGSRDVPMDLTAQRTGKKFGLVDVWQVRGLPLARITLGMPAEARGLRVNGVDVPVEPGVARVGQGVSLPALPGTYTLALPQTSKFLVPVTVERRVMPLDVPTVTQLGYRATPELVTQAQAQTRQLLDACVKQTVLAPTGCPWALDQADGQVVRNIAWTLLAAPATTIAPTQDANTWALVGQTPGMARITYQVADAAANPQVWAPGLMDIDFMVKGVVHIEGDTVRVTLR